MSKKTAVAKRPARALVLDCSIVMAWYFVDERSALADAVARQLSDQIAFVPMNWTLEVINALMVGERRKRSTQAQAATFLKNLADMPITIDDETNLHAGSTTLSLARERSLTAYDAAYLELAMRRGLPLATLDEQLKTAAHTVGVALYRMR